MRLPVPLLAIVLAVPAIAGDKAPVDADLITEVMTSVINPSVQNIRYTQASAKAFAQTKETLARQRAAGRKPRAPAGIINTELRLRLRAHSGRLRTGTRWRSWPKDEVYAAEAAVVAARLEELAANLGPVRSWNCAYDEEAESIVKSRLGYLAFKGNLLDSDEPDPAPRLTPRESAFLDGPLPKLAAAPPRRNENAIGWLDWAAAREASTVMHYMRRARSRLEAKKGKHRKRRVLPSSKRVREAIRLWSRAEMLKNGAGSAYDPPAKRLNVQTRRVVISIARKYDRTPLKVLHDCQADEYAFGKIGRAAKRLLAAP